MPMKETVVVSVRIPKALSQQIDDVAEGNDQTSGELIRNAIGQYLGSDVDLSGYDQGRRDARQVWMNALREEITEAFDRADKKAKERMRRK